MDAWRAQGDSAVAVLALRPQRLLCSVGQGPVALLPAAAGHRQCLPSIVLHTASRVTDAFMHR